jgi:predicted molibdopterin-dependent oxidoreductase YjgC
MDMGVLPDFYPGGMAVSDAEKVSAAWGENAPTSPGYSALEMIEQAEQGKLKALWVYRADPLADFPGGARLRQALEKLDVLVVHDIMQTETSKLANIVLMSNGPGFDEGTTTNIGGRVQYRRGGLKTSNAPDWKIISMMEQALSDDAPDYLTSFSVTGEIAEKVSGYGEINKTSIKQLGKPRAGLHCEPGDDLPVAPGDSQGLKLRVSTCLFSQDKMLDASSSLAHHFQSSQVHLHEQDAERLGVKSGDPVVLVSGQTEVRAEAKISNRCNPGGVLAPKVSDEQGIMELLSGLGSTGEVEVRKA